MKVSRRDTIDRYYLLDTRWFSVFLHRIHHSDPPDVMHTHPWSWTSFIFGSYAEERPGQGPIRRYLVNSCKAGTPHRVTIDRPVWTLLIHGPRRVTWAVTDLAGNVIEAEPWRGTENPTRTSYTSSNAK